MEYNTAKPTIVFVLEPDVTKSLSDISNIGAEGSISLIGQRPIALLPKILQDCKFIQRSSGESKAPRAYLDERFLEPEQEDDILRHSNSQKKSGNALRDREKVLRENNSPNTPTTNASVAEITPQFISSFKHKFPTPLLLSKQISPHVPDTEDGIWSVSPKLRADEETKENIKNTSLSQARSNRFQNAFVGRTRETQEAVEMDSLSDDAKEDFVDDEKDLNINRTIILRKSNQLRDYLLRKHNTEARSQDHESTAKRPYGGHMIMSLSAIRKPSASRFSTFTMEANEASRRSHQTLQKHQGEFLPSADLSASSIHT